MLFSVVNFLKCVVTKVISFSIVAFKTLRFSPNSVALLGKYVAVVEYRPIMSVNIVSQFQSNTSGH